MNGNKIELDDHSNAARMNPTVYAGTIWVETSQKEMSIQKAAESVRCGPLQDRRGRWALTEYGIECLAQYYPIESSRVHEIDWLRQLSEKTWMSEQDKREFEDILKLAQAKWPQ